MLVVGTPAAPGHEVDVRKLGNEIEQDWKALVRARVDHADFSLVDIVANTGHATSVGVEVSKVAVNEKVGVEITVRHAVVLNGARDGPDTV